MKNSSNKRRYSRLPKSSSLKIQKLTFSEETKEDDAVYKDVGGGGILFESKALYEIGALLKLKVDVPGWGKFIKNFKRPDENDKKILTAIGEVVRVEEIEKNKIYEIGVKFVNIQDNDFDSLIQYIENSIDLK